MAVGFLRMGGRLLTRKYTWKKKKTPKFPQQKTNGEGESLKQSRAI